MSHNRLILIFVVSLFLIGLILGNIAVLMMPMEQKLELEEQIRVFFDPTEQKFTVEHNQNVWENSSRYLLIGLVITLLGLSVIGVPFVLFYLFIKGIILGFTSGFIINQMGGEGISFILYTLLPQNALLIPTLIFFTASCVGMALYILKNRIIKFHGRLAPQLTSYFTISLGTIVTLVIIGIYESVIFPLLYHRALLLTFDASLLFDL